jgi:hypothetical protein
MSARRWLVVVAGATAALAAGLYIRSRSVAPSRVVAEASPPAVVEARTTSRPTPLAPEYAAWMMTTLDDIFDDESRDETWAAELEAKIRAVRQDEALGGVTSLDVECRKSMCRVVVGMDPTKARRTLQMLTMTAPLNTSGFHGIDPVDRKKLRIFVSREGTRLMAHPALVAAFEARGG